MRSSLRIAVTGLAATFPFGGVFWDYLQYVLGFARLGHDVLYLEDTGRWCYDPAAATFVETGERNAARLADAIKILDPDLADRWFFRDGPGHTYGRSWSDVVRFVKSADLFVHVSASCFMRDEYFEAARVVFIDTDPMYTQDLVPVYLADSLEAAAHARIEFFRRHHAFFTFATNIGAPDCRVPSGLFRWIPTRQPIVLDRFEPESVPVAARRRVLTTVASWEPTERAPVVEGVVYRGKSAEFERFVELPARSPLPLELAMSGPAPAARFTAHGWRIVDGYAISEDPWTYRSYLARSLGEWSVAKHAYVASRSGWFSCRSACYLALGVPVVVQDTGFGSAIPTGRGIQTFSTLEEAAAAIDRLRTDPDGHAAAAHEIAHAYFDAATVLPQLIAQAFA